jgi:cardiolipin synthase (CMP-forming)
VPVNVGGRVGEIELAHVVGRHDVNMDVGHLVTCDDHAYTLATEGRLLRFPHTLGYRHEMRHGFGRQVNPMVDFSPRNDQHMTSRERVNGQEDSADVVGIHEGGGNLAREDPAEDAHRAMVGAYDRCVPPDAPPMADRTALQDALTVPNLVTVIRLCCIPWFLWILFHQHNRFAAAWLLAAIGATDWIDGYIARRFHQVSELGKVLDPTADRLLFIVGVAGIIIDRSAPLWFCVLVVVREVLIGGSLAILTLLGMKRFDVSWWGKTATFLLMFAFPLFLLHASGRPNWSPGAEWLAWIFGIPGLILSYYTAFTYVPMMRRALAAGRQERASQRG